MIIKIRNPPKHQHLVAGPDGTMHLVVSQGGAHKLRFAPRTAQQQAAVAAPAVPTAQVQQTRVLRKISRDTPPNIPFLRFETIVGRGGMAVVWRAWHRELNRPVAVKVLDSKFSNTEQDVRQFMMEVRTMSNLHHQGIVQGYGADFADGRYYFIMDYVDGYTFGSLLTRKTHIPEIDVLIVCESVADAMKYAWDVFAVVHCDLKPENIMVDRDGTIKVTDLPQFRTRNSQTRWWARPPTSARSRSTATWSWTAGRTSTASAPRSTTWPPDGCSSPSPTTTAFSART